MTFAEKNFRLCSGVRRISEPRPAWEIPLPQMIGLSIYAVASGHESLHQIDQLARTPEARRFCGSDRAMVVSDSTLQRVLRMVDPAEVAELQRQVVRGVRQMGCQSIRLPGGRSVRVAVVDGSVLGGRRYSVLDLVGSVDSLPDLEPFDQKGDELPASARLLRRQVDIAGRGFADYLLGDGLYMTEPMMRLCLDELDVHLLVKTTEVETLNILKDANALFDSAEPFAEVQHCTGIDEERGVVYEIWAAAGFHHQGVDDLKVARVREQDPKHPDRSLDPFWVVSTDGMLTPEQMRELAKDRWSIENRGFRALNAMAWSKHQWVRPAAPTTSEAQRQQIEQYFEVILRLMMIAHMLVQAFAVSQDQEALRRHYGGLRLTVAFIGQRLLQTMGVARMIVQGIPEG